MAQGVVSLQHEHERVLGKQANLNTFLETALYYREHCLYVVTGKVTPVLAKCGAGDSRTVVDDTVPSLVPEP